MAFFDPQAGYWAKREGIGGLDAGHFAKILDSAAGLLRGEAQKVPLAAIIDQPEIPPRT
ncbi:MAG: hypothetical protein LBP92_06960 [Deltaproteobacteria bacterium]|jgi:hypothetical protein|nr:hypothetical protein [Deltaproteobacteria bacterium]